MESGPHWTVVSGPTVPPTAPVRSSPPERAGVGSTPSPLTAIDERSRVAHRPSTRTGRPLGSGAYQDPADFMADVRRAIALLERNRYRLTHTNVVRRLRIKRTAYFAYRARWPFSLYQEAERTRGASAA
jgi:hypothetical protein